MTDSNSMYLYDQTHFICQQQIFVLAILMNNDMFSGHFLITKW